LHFSKRTLLEKEHFAKRTLPVKNNFSKRTLPVKNNFSKRTLPPQEAIARYGERPDWFAPPVEGRTSASATHLHSTEQANEEGIPC